MPCLTGLPEIPAGVMIGRLDMLQLIGLLFLVTGFAACASVETRLPVPDALLMKEETQAQEEKAFARYLDLLERLDIQAARILQANTDLCPKTHGDPGILTHTLKSYPKHLRDAAARRLGAKETPSILLVRKGGPVSGHRLEKGDFFVNEKDEPVHFSDAGDVVRVQTSAGIKTLSFAPVSACDYKVRLKFSSAINAYATGKSIIVTTGMMDFVENDSELALILGHELAHNTMGHVRKSIQNILLSGLATRYTRPFESEADYVGMYYMARAGYPLDGVETFWRRLGIEHPKSIVRAKTHPVTPSRMLSIHATAREIAEKRKNGEALTPNFLEGKGPKPAGKSTSPWP